MPLLSTEINDFLQRVKDDLRYGQDRGTRATVELSADTGSGELVITADELGAAGNSYSVEVTSPGGTAALGVTESGGAITVALSVSTGTPVDADNTLDLIAAEINSSVTGVTARVSYGGGESIDSAVSTTSFSGGADPDTNVDTASTGAGYLRAQDMATVLQLLQEATDSDGNLTATGGTTTTAVVSSITSGAYVGATVTFDAATTTAALQGETATVASNDGTTFTFVETLPAAVSAGDTFTVTQTFMDAAISQLREGQGLAGAPRGSVYGEWRTVIDALERMRDQLAGSSLTNRAVSRPGLQTGSGSTTTAVVSADTMRIDAFKGYYLTIGGETRRITRNDETTLTVAPALSSAPSAATSFTIQLQTTDGQRFPGRFWNANTGGHPDSAFLSYLLDVVQSDVDSFTLPS